MKLTIGSTVKIIDNGRITTHITPRWSYGYYGTVIRLNDLSASIMLMEPYAGEKIRVDYADLEIIEEAPNDPN